MILALCSYLIHHVSVMHLSMVCPTTPTWGDSRGFVHLNRSSPRGGALSHPQIKCRLGGGHLAPAIFTDFFVGGAGHEIIA